ncbi:MULTISPECIES: porin [unclassified Undibacterium]|uniref:porin n=1 Tax=unclassified Undibacterium TaxID=2630295 RepID=UPI002AC9B9BA|nr:MULTISPECIES: porin [unclassified Undibacterium]MEB0138437.1 porin [Undibacterium sp. CCC2.1]MEB0171312.1 porin [Undibacterium sp. CCC1.1]MEB0176451.1 porin [Undibacterium sp. CCC3.4]MEB0214066.1 porin [Undibacterium sp. 5I2]WPX43678.1 porin [Undibacterium sp. CCC3.4]
MNKQVIALALMAGGTSLAQAQSNVTIYGSLDQYLGYISSTSGTHVFGINDGSVLRSRLGFRGVEELGDGYQAKFNLEQGLNADTGASADSNHLFDRQAWVGINTPLGEFRLGRQNTEIFFIGGAIDYTERTTFGSVVNTFGVPSRYDNDMSYKTPRLAGFQGALHYALGEQAGGGVSQSAVMQFSLDFSQGPYRIGYAGLSAKPAPSGSVQEKIQYHNVYADYDYGQGKVYFAYVHSNNNTASANGLTAATILSNVANPNNLFAGTDKNANRYFNIYQLSGDYRINQQVRVGALYGVIKDTTGGNAGAKGGNIGVFYDLSKRTTLYTFASVLSNAANAGFRFSGSAAPAANLAGADVNGQRLSGLQTGFVHKF